MALANQKRAVVDNDDSQKLRDYKGGGGKGVPSLLREFMNDKRDQAGEGEGEGEGKGKGV